jgi:hypothetical protein
LAAKKKISKGKNFASQTFSFGIAVVVTITNNIQPIYLTRFYSFIPSKAADNNPNCYSFQIQDP